MIDYKTTFLYDFRIAELFGIKAIKDTYKRAFKEWKNNVEFVTELCIVLNHKIWEWHLIDEQIARTYDLLWKQCRDYCYENLKGKDLEYFLKETD